MITLPRKLVILALAVIGWSLPFAQGATSASHFGFTWTFSSDRPTGTFANGEPWVVGPVTITAISPNPSQSITGVQNGSMKNPRAGARQGFENNGNTGIPEVAYDASLNVALQLPLSLVGGDVLVSSKTNPANQFPLYFDTVCALTVLSAAPPSGSFRTGLYGNDHAVRWNKSQINWSILKNLASVPLAPTKAQIEEKLPPLPWFEWHSHQAAGLYNPWRNIAAGNGGDGKPSTYGREIAFKWSEVALWLQLDHPQADKEKALIQTIQCGIDIWSYATNGGGFYHDGGHKCGRKFPVYLAAIALNDPVLLKFVENPNVFQEDMQTFFVTQNDIGRVLNPGNGGYTQAQLGMPEWGVRHRWEPQNDDSRWTGGVPYRHVVWPAMVGAVLAADLMDKEAAWGHPAIFAYNDRYYAAGGVSGFVAHMASYKYGGKIVNPPDPGAPSVIQNFSVTTTSAPQTATWTGEAGTLQTHIYLLNPATNQYAFLTHTQGNATSVQLSLPPGTHRLQAARENSVTWSGFSPPITITINGNQPAPSRTNNLRIVK